MEPRHGEGQGREERGREGGQKEGREEGKEGAHVSPSRRVSHGVDAQHVTIAAFEQQKCPCTSVLCESVAVMPLPFTHPECKGVSVTIPVSPLAFPLKCSNKNKCSAAPIPLFTFFSLFMCYSQYNNMKHWLYYVTEILLFIHNKRIH